MADSPCGLFLQFLENVRKDFWLLEEQHRSRGVLGEEDGDFENDIDNLDVCEVIHNAGGEQVNQFLDDVLLGAPKYNVVKKD